MKLRTNKVRSIIIFVGTLVLGVTALAISWRLQQERAVTPEESHARPFGDYYFCNYQDGACSYGAHATYYSSQPHDDGSKTPCISFQLDNPRNGDFWTQIMGADPIRQKRTCKGGWDPYGEGKCWTYPESNPYYSENPEEFDMASCASCKNIELLSDPTEKHIEVKAYSRNLIPYINGDEPSKPYLHKANSKTEFRLRVLNSSGNVVNEEIIDSSHSQWGNVECKLVYSQIGVDEDLGDRITWDPHNKNIGNKIWDCEITYTWDLPEPLSDGNYSIEISSRMPIKFPRFQPGYKYVYWRHPDMVLTKAKGNIQYDFPTAYLEEIGVGTNPTYRQMYNSTTVDGAFYDFASDPNNTCVKNFQIVGPSAVCKSKTISTGTAAIDPGQGVTFTITYTNGPVAGTILMDDEIPNGFENVTVTSPSTGCTVTGNTIACRIAGVAANATGTVVVSATARTNIRDLATTNTAYVNIDADNNGTEDAVDSSCTTGTTVSEANAVCESKTSNITGEDQVVQPGDIIAYTIQYTVVRGPATVYIKDEMPEYTSIYTDGACALPTGCTATGDTLDCVFTNAETGTYINSMSFCVQVDETGIPLDGVDIVNDEVKVWEGTATDEPESYAENCTTTVTVEHELPACIVTNPSVLTIRQQDVDSTTISLTTTGDLGTYENLEFRWTATGGTLSSTEWHVASETPSGGTVDDMVTWSPPTDAVDTDTYDIKAYVRPVGSTDEIGISAEACEATSTITALDLVCLYLIPNDPIGSFPLDMTFEADIGGDEGAAFTYDLDFDDGTTHYTGSDTVAAGTTVELPYIPPQSSPHTYDNTTPISFSPVLVVTNTETGEESICPTVLSGTTQSSWSIVKDSDVNTCVVANSVVAYSIIVKNTGDYSADLEEVRDTVDTKINTATITNIRECDVNGANCTTYNKTDVLSGRTITWPGRTYSAGESRKYMYSVTVSTAGDYYNIAEAVPTVGKIVRDDETFPTCTVGTTPTTGTFSSAVYAIIFASILGALGAYVYQTRTGAQVAANVLGKTQRAVWRKSNKKEAFERDMIRSSKKKA